MVLAVGAIAGLLSLALLGCGEKTFSEGDCVTVEQQTIDSEMKEADCPDPASGNSPLSEDPVFSVDEVIDGTGGICTPQGFGPITFSDEPADKTYCLSVAD